MINVIIKLLNQQIKFVIILVILKKQILKIETFKNS